MDIPSPQVLIPNAILIPEDQGPLQKQLILEPQQGKPTTEGAHQDDSGTKWQSARWPKPEQSEQQHK